MILIVLGTGITVSAQLAIQPQPPSEISITISPASVTVASSASQQFTALVRGTSKTGVNWSASAGKISGAGLFVAPAVTATTTVTVTARSVTNPLKKATSTVTVMAHGSGSSPTITTTTIPDATAGISYSASLAATGGKTPYQWSVSAGALPSGIQLNSSTGAFSGSTSSLGSFSFTAKVTDASKQAAQQKLVLLVSHRGNCGPPSYPCSRTDTAVIVPTSLPRLGNNSAYSGGHSGAGMVAIDSDYGSLILRVTDGNTTTPGMSFNTGSSAEKNLTSYDESMFLIHDEGNGLCLFQFNQSAFKTTFHGCFNNLGQGGGADFGYTAADNYAIYNYAAAKLYRFVINPANWQVAADPTFNHGQGYFDPDSPQCLNGQIAANHWYIGGRALSSDDSTLIASVGPGQDKDIYYVVWNASKGCYWLNAKTWQVSRGWNTGQSSPVNISWVSGKAPTTAGGIHNAQIDRSGSYGVLGVHFAFRHKLFWQIGSNVVDDTCVNCTSHWACDFGVCFWDFQHGSGYDMWSRAIKGSVVSQNMNPTPAMGQWGNDEHASHANAEPGATNIYLVSWEPGHGGSTVGQVWEDEITGVSWDGSQRTIRFGKNWNSGYGGFWTSARCSISRQGHYALCGSDYQMYNLDKGFGNGLNQDTCNHTLPASHRGTMGCRTDVLLFELR